jgi:hypothetical protein
MYDGGGFYIKEDGPHAGIYWWYDNGNIVKAIKKSNYDFHGHETCTKRTF